MKLIVISLAPVAIVASFALSPSHERRFAGKAICRLRKNEPRKPSHRHSLEVRAPGAGG